MQLKVKMPKTAQIRNLEASKQERKYRLKYLDVSNLQQEYGWCFEHQTTTWKLIETFLGVINKQGRCGLCIYSVELNRIGMFDVFTSSNVTKRYKEDI